MPTATHTLDLATRLEPAGAERLAGTMSEAYWNFAGPFGGYIAALFMRAVMIDPRRLGPPVAQTVNFCAAAHKAAFEIELKLERDGRATQHWSMKMIQGGIIVATGSLVCANRRETFSHMTAKMPDVPRPDDVAVLPPHARLPWLDSYEFRYHEGSPGFDKPRAPDDLGGSRTVLWMRDKPDRALDFVALAALADCFILRLVQMRGTLVPMATVTMTTHFHATEPELQIQGSAPLLGVADSQRFNANFHDQSMELWGANGHLLASGMQTVWYKE